MRTIEIPADTAFDLLELIDDRAEQLRDNAAACRDWGKGGVSAEYGALAKAWEADAVMIRRALGIEIDGEG